MTRIYQKEAAAAATVATAILHSSHKQSILDAGRVLARYRGAEPKDAIPRPTIPKQLPPPIHSTARHGTTQGWKRRRQHGNVSSTKPTHRH
ncbi:60S ribosomal protein L7a [Lates japonicus]|uniref:60S ribosomal protein L7a n=1 Tax=Lates japonicus TaxID=270547 RepID=A0AAD3MDA0_LATJO|nr:60S ribosomal protein L7a [Lates japonicus]